MADTSTRVWGIGGRTITNSVTRVMSATTDYAAEDVMADAATAGTALTFDIGKNKGAGGYITNASMQCSTTGLTPRMTLFLFRKTPTAGNLNDNAVNTSVHTTDRPNYVGKIDFPAWEDIGGNSESEATPSTVGKLPRAFNCDGADRNLYGILATRDAITGEAAGMTVVTTLTSEWY